MTRQETQRRPATRAFKKRGTDRKITERAYVKTRTSQRNPETGEIEEYENKRNVTALALNADKYKWFVPETRLVINPFGTGPRKSHGFISTDKKAVKMFEDFLLDFPHRSYVDKWKILFERSSGERFTDFALYGPVKKVLLKAMQDEKSNDVPRKYKQKVFNFIMSEDAKKKKNGEIAEDRYWMNMRLGRLGELLVHSLLRLAFPFAVKVNTDKFIFRVHEDQEHYDFAFKLPTTNKKEKAHVFVVCVKSSFLDPTFRDSSRAFIHATNEELEQIEHYRKLKEVVHIVRFRVGFLNIENPLGSDVFIAYTKQSNKYNNQYTVN